MAAMTFGDKLSRLRDLRGLTQAMLAAAIGVDPRQVRRWESGESYGPPPRDLLAIARHLGVDVAWLCDDDAGWPPAGAGWTDGR